MTEKAFDGVDLKRKPQEALRREYESRRAEFATCFDFLPAQVEESQWARRSRQAIRDASRTAPS